MDNTVVCPRDDRYHRCPDALTRFWSKVDKAEDGCWNWMASVFSARGYGQFKAHSGCPGVKAHRYAYEALIGPVPSDLQLDHLCRNTRCVNPDHLEPVTRAENIRRGFSCSAVNARKTHCPRGHEYDPRDIHGRRPCKQCARGRAASRRTIR